MKPLLFFSWFDKIDAESLCVDADRPHAQRQAAFTLMMVALCLLVIHYFKFNSNFQAALGMVSTMLNQPEAWLSTRLQFSGFIALASQLWWGVWLLIGYVLIPFCFIRYVLGQHVIDFGLRLENTRAHWIWYLLLLCPIVVFAVLASFREDFVNHYPFYRMASRSWFDLLSWELIYLSQFVFLEFFFRGFMLNALKPAFGSNAIFVMCVPYLMIHFPKPWLEASGAILFGLFLGLLAMRSRSIWGGVAVHAGVALSMDFAALMQTKGLPDRWWPF